MLSCCNKPAALHGHVVLLAELGSGSAAPTVQELTHLAGPLTRYLTPEQAHQLPGAPHVPAHLLHQHPARLNAVLQTAAEMASTGSVIVVQAPWQELLPQAATVLIDQASSRGLPGFHITTALMARHLGELSQAATSQTKPRLLLDYGALVRGSPEKPSAGALTLGSVSEKNLVQALQGMAQHAAQYSRFLRPLLGLEAGSKSYLTPRIPFDLVLNASSQSHKAMARAIFDHLRATQQTYRESSLSEAAPQARNLAQQLYGPQPQGLHHAQHSLRGSDFHGGSGHQAGGGHSGGSGAHHGHSGGSAAHHSGGSAAHHGHSGGVQAHGDSAPRRQGNSGGANAGGRHNGDTPASHQAGGSHPSHGHSGGSGHHPAHSNSGGSHAAHGSGHANGSGHAAGAHGNSGGSHAAHGSGHAAGHANESGHANGSGHAAGHHHGNSGGGHAAHGSGHANGSGHAAGHRGNAGEGHAHPAHHGHGNSGGGQADREQVSDSGRHHPQHHPAKHGHRANDDGEQQPEQHGQHAKQGKAKKHAAHHAEEEDEQPRKHGHAGGHAGHSHEGHGHAEGHSHGHAGHKHAPPADEEAPVEAQNFGPEYADDVDTAPVEHADGGYDDDEGYARHRHHAHRHGHQGHHHGHHHHGHHHGHHHRGHHHGGAAFAGCDDYDSGDYYQEYHSQPYAEEDCAPPRTRESCDDGYANEGPAGPGRGRQGGSPVYASVDAAVADFAAAAPPSVGAPADLTPPPPKTIVSEANAVCVKLAPKYTCTAWRFRGWSNETPAEPQF